MLGPAAAAAAALVVVPVKEGGCAGGKVEEKEENREGNGRKGASKGRKDKWEEGDSYTGRSTKSTFFN